MDEKPDMPQNQQPPAEASTLPEPPSQAMPPAAPQPKKGMSRKKKIILGMVIALVVLIVVAGATGGIYAWRFLSAANNLTIEDVPISSIPDGTYEGTYSVFHVKAAVGVTVEDGEITDIEILDSGSTAEETLPKIEALLRRVVVAQSLEVDMESGASVTQKVTLKAVEEALSGAQ